MKVTEEGKEARKMIALKEYRVRKGYTQKQIAETLKVTTVCITQ